MTKIERKAAVSACLLLFASCACSLWVLSYVWAYGQVTVQEPRVWILAIETAGLAVAGVLGLLGVVWFWRKK